MTVTSCVLACSVWIVALGCTPTPSPYLRDLQPAYDSTGKVDPDSYRINRAWMQHMLKDLDQCYGDTR